MTVVALAPNKRSYQYWSLSTTGNARTTRCALKRGQVVFIRRRRFHSTHLNSFEKVISIQLIWKSDFYSIHLKKSSSFNSFENIVLIYFIRTNRFHSIESVSSYFILLIWENRHLFNQFEKNDFHSIHMKMRFILNEILVFVENMIEIFMTFTSWRKRKTLRLETSMQMKTLFIISFNFCVNASFFEKSSRHSSSRVMWFIFQ